MPTVTTTPKYTYWRRKATKFLSNGAMSYYNAGPQDLTCGHGNDTRTTQNNPNWKIQIDKKVDASNPYQISRNQVTPAYLSCMVRASSFGTKYEITDRMVICPADTLTYSNGDENTRLLALTRLKRKLRDHAGSYNFGAPLAEIRDLHRTYVGLVDLTTKAYSTLLEIKKTRGKSAVKYASRAWLTFSFGVNPMLRDIDALFDTIASWVLRQDRSVRLAGSAKRDWIGTSDVRLLYGDNNFYEVIGKLRAEHSLSYRYVTAFDYKIEAGNDYTVKDHFGLGLPALLPAVWEVTPYSWAIDYFTNVGNLLDDIFLMPSGNTRYVTLSRRYAVETISDLHWSKLAGSDTEFLSQVVENWSNSFYDFQRTVETGLPYSGFRIRTQSEIAKFATNKLLNLAAVLFKDVDTRGLPGWRPSPVHSGDVSFNWNKIAYM